MQQFLSGQTPQARCLLLEVLMSLHATACTSTLHSIMGIFSTCFRVTSEVVASFSTTHTLMQPSLLAVYTVSDKSVGVEQLGIRQWGKLSDKGSYCKVSEVKRMFSTCYSSNHAGLNTKNDLTVVIDSCFNLQQVYIWQALQEIRTCNGQAWMFWHKSLSTLVHVHYIYT